jgi:hypothetical protein
MNRNNNNSNNQPIPEGVLRRDNGVWRNECMRRTLAQEQANCQLYHIDHQRVAIECLLHEARRHDAATSPHGSTNERSALWQDLSDYVLTNGEDDYQGTIAKLSSMMLWEEPRRRYLYAYYEEELLARRINQMRTLNRLKTQSQNGGDKFFLAPQTNHTSTTTAINHNNNNNNINSKSSKFSGGFGLSASKQQQQNQTSASPIPQSSSAFSTTNTNTMKKKDASPTDSPFTIIDTNQQQNVFTFSAHPPKQQQVVSSSMTMNQQQQRNLPPFPTSNNNNYGGHQQQQPHKKVYLPLPLPSPTNMPSGASTPKFSTSQLSSPLLNNNNNNNNVSGAVYNNNNNNNSAVNSAQNSAKLRQQPYLNNNNNTELLSTGGFEGSGRLPSSLGGSNNDVESLFTSSLPHNNNNNGQQTQQQHQHQNQNGFIINNNNQNQQQSGSSSYQKPNTKNLIFLSLDSNDSRSPYDNSTNTPAGGCDAMEVVVDVESARCSPQQQQQQQMFNMNSRHQQLATTRV